jgi:hypothetical protein
MKLEGALLERYLHMPLAMDSEVRSALNIPDNRYYIVSVWPNAGKVRLTLSREVKSKKISKSDHSNDH